MRLESGASREGRADARAGGRRRGHRSGRRSFRVGILWGGVLALLGGCTPAEGEPASLPESPARYGLGRDARPEEIEALALSIAPDGRGLPEGRGSARDGAPIYAARCAACHGVEGEGGSGGVLAGRIPDDAFDFGDGMPGARTIGSYWPYATTVFDYVRRSMPFDRPGSLTDSEVYAVTAHLLYLNGIVGAEEVLDRTSLPQVEMPARDRFVPDDRLTRNRVW